MPLARWAVYQGGPQIWVAPTADDSDGWQASMRHIAIESGAFVVSVPQYIPRQRVPGRLPGRGRPRASLRPRRRGDRRADLRARSSPARSTTARGCVPPTATCAAAAREALVRRVGHSRTECSSTSSRCAQPPAPRAAARARARAADRRGTPARLISTSRAAARARAGRDVGARERVAAQRGLPAAASSRASAADLRRRLGDRERHVGGRRLAAASARRPPRVVRRQPQRGEHRRIGRQVGLGERERLGAQRRGARRVGVARPRSARPSRPAPRRARSPRPPPRRRPARACVPRPRRGTSPGSPRCPSLRRCVRAPHQPARNDGGFAHCPSDRFADRNPTNARREAAWGRPRGSAHAGSHLRAGREPASAEQLTRDSAILGEQFYFFTVVLMWLIHAGFMSYEAGVARRKNVMATAMKNILTIAVVTPTFYYFGWWIYNCNQAGPADRAEQQRLHLRRLPGRHPVERRLRAEPHEQHQPDLLPGVPAVQLDDGVDHVRRAHRARAAVGVPRARVRARLGRLDPRRRLGLERRRLADDALRLPRLDRLRRRPRRRGRVHARRALQPRAADRQVHEGGAGAAVQTAQPAHHRARADVDIHRASTRSTARAS